MIWLWFWFDMLIMFPLYLDYQYETLTSLVTGVLWPCLLMPPTAWLEVGRVMSQPVPSVIICMHTIIMRLIICSGAYGCILDLLSVMFVPLFCQWSEYVALYSITSGSWSLHCRYMKAIFEGGTLCIRSMWWKYW